MIMHDKTNLNNHQEIYQHKIKVYAVFYDDSYGVYEVIGITADKEQANIMKSTSKYIVDTYIEELELNLFTNQDIDFIAESTVREVIGNI